LSLCWCLDREAWRWPVERHVHAHGVCVFLTTATGRFGHVGSGISVHSPGRLYATPCDRVEWVVVIYTYRFLVGPDGLRWILEPIVKWIFGWQTRRRFARLRKLLSRHADEAALWQK
jgi:hypothetical protein